MPASSAVFRLLLRVAAGVAFTFSTGSAQGGSIGSKLRGVEVEGKAWAPEIQAEPNALRATQPGSRSADLVEAFDTKLPILDATRLRGHLAAIVSSEPRRLSPGRDGVLHLVLSLRRDAVLRPGQHFKLDYSQSQAGVLLGDWQLEPPRGPSTLASAFVGQMVYDNTVTLRVPVQIGSEVEHGQHSIEFALECDVYDGETGDYRGRYAMPVKTRVVVGDPVPTPSRRRREAVEPKDVSSDRRESFRSADATLDRSTPEGSAVRAGEAEIALESSRVDRADAGMSEAELGQGGSPAVSSWLYGSAGVFLVLVVLLMLARGRAQR